MHIHMVTIPGRRAAALLVLGVASAGLLAAGAAHAAPPIDCATPIAQAQKKIDKITGDLQGMEKMMRASEMTELNGLVGEARHLNKTARAGCAPGLAASRQARAIAEATSANGYATAADILHYHYMEAAAATMKGMGAQSKGSRGMGSQGMGNQADMAQPRAR